MSVLTEITVQKVMSTPFCVPEGTPIVEAIHTMSEKGYGTIVVISSGGLYRGLIDRDQLIDVAAHEGGEAELTKLSVNDFLYHPPVLQAGATLAEAAKMMDKHHSRQIVIVDSSLSPTGLITQGHIVKALDGGFSEKKS